jgi:hypothetical protein
MFGHVFRHCGVHFTGVKLSTLNSGPDEFPPYAGDLRFSFLLSSNFKAPLCLRILLFPLKPLVFLLTIFLDPGCCL